MDVSSTDSSARTVATLRAIIVRLRETVAPSYRPELYYMRGPGPACARRTAGAA